MAADVEIPSVMEQINAAFVTCAFDGLVVGSPRVIEVGRYVWEQLEQEGHITYNEKGAPLLTGGWRLYRVQQVGKRQIRLCVSERGKTWSTTRVVLDIQLPPRPQSPCYAARKIRKQKRKGT